MEDYRRLRKKTTETRTVEKELRKLVEMKTGKEAGFPKLAGLPKLWLDIPRRKTPGKHYVAQCTAILDRFVAFEQTAKSGVKEFVEVTPEIAKAYLDAEASAEFRTALGTTRSSCCGPRSSGYIHSYRTARTRSGSTSPRQRIR